MRVYNHNQLYRDEFKVIVYILAVMIQGSGGTTSTPTYKDIHTLSHLVTHIIHHHQTKSG